VKGSKKTYRDYKFTKNILSNKSIYKTEYTANELSELKRIKYDAVRLAPFSVFMLVPFLEVFLPPYLLLL